MQAPSFGHHERVSDPMRFPVEEARRRHAMPSNRPEPAAAKSLSLPQSTDDVFAMFDTVSRRIDDLARELNCLGYFDDETGRPRAA